MSSSAPGPGGDAALRQIAADAALARSLQQDFERELLGAGRQTDATPLLAPNRRGRGAYMAAGLLPQGAGRMGAAAVVAPRPPAGAPPGGPRGGGGGGGGGSPAQQNQRVRMNVLQNGIREVNNRRLVVFLTLVVNLPQLVAAAVVLSLHWDDDAVCDADHRERWKWWAAVAAARLAVYTGLLVALYLVLLRRPRDAREVIVLSNARNGVDALGLIWFVVGNMWLFGQTESCDGAGASPVYQLCVAMLLVTYLHICLPCLIAMLMIPVLCFCLPCVIRVLARLQDPMRGKGANQAAIDKLKIIKYRPDLPEIEEPTCPICLNEYENGEELRSLPCKHSFHKKCVDEWLLVNATCPNCRTTILDEEQEEEAKLGEEGA